MKKKGFTLTELLAVIVILGVITLIAIPSSFAISNRIKINLYCTKMDTIKKAADLYASDHFDEVRLGIITKVSIKDLVNYGYVKKDENPVNNILVVDPRDNETSLDDMTISLSISNNRAKTNFDQENYYFLCGDEKRKDKKDPSCLYKGESKTWTNKNRTITISCYDAGSGCKTKDEVKTYSTTTKTDSINYTVRDWVGNSFRCSKNINVYVDKTNPSYQIVGAASNSNDWSNKRIITVKCVDNDSGCKTADQKFEYGILSSDVTKRNVNTDTITFTVEDNAGNKKTYTEEVNVYTDVDNPTCTYYGESESWTNEDRSIQVVCEDALSGCKTASTSLTIGESAGAQEINFVAEDNAGNQTNCTKSMNVYIDKVKPTIGEMTYANGIATIEVADTQQLKKYEIYNSSNTKEASGNLTGTSATVNFEKTTSGTYTIKVYDVAGNVGSAEFTIPQYKVTFKVNDADMGSVANGSKKVDYSGSASTTFTVNDGYHYVSVSGTGCSVSGTTVTATNVTKNVTCTVKLEINTYTVTFNTNNANYGTVTDSTVTVEHGSSGSTTFSAKTGYHYASVSGTGCSVSGTTVTASNVTGNVTCTVTFAINSYTVTFKSNDTGMGTVADASKTVNHGGSASTTLSPKTNYHYASVSGTGCSVSGTTVTASNVAGNVTCTVTFAIDTHTVTFKVNNTGMGTVASGSATVNHGSNGSTTFSAKTGYHYASVSGTGCSVSGTTVTASNVTGNVTCTVTFAINSYTVTFKSNNTGMGTVASGSATVNHGSSGSTTFSAKTGYHYASVSGTGCSVSGTTVTASNVTSNVTCTVTFAINTYTVTFKSNNTGMGTVATGSVTVNYNSSGSTTFSAKSGYNYNGVSGSGCSVSGSTVTASNVTSNRTCTVNFADKTAPTTPTFQLSNPVIKNGSASYSLKASGSSDATTITYQVYINGSWVNTSGGIYNGTLSKGQDYWMYARACDTSSNCSGNSIGIHMAPKTLYIWQVYQYMRSNAGSTIIAQPNDGEIAVNMTNTKMAQNAKNMYMSTEAQRYFNSVGVNQAVKNMYRGILGRDADSGGLTNNVSYYNSNGLEKTLLVFVNSDEAQAIYNYWGMGSGKL